MQTLDPRPKMTAENGENPSLRPLLTGIVVMLRCKIRSVMPFSSKFTKNGIK